ncbi:hypothetical protein D9615_000207 [Tricholomella constricta]|uniref:Uncharacterized protein n=1 Tax=Tricholomella constricta TaxID=117010 RepID=A0A8H5HRG2_9AGAR|nr:hypothetical protein D9615_000207 [Tricholomella constricta]
MPVCSLPYHVLAPVLHSVTRTSSQRLLGAYTRLSSTLTLTPDIPDPTPTPEPSSSSPQVYLRHRKFLELKDSLIRGGSPSRVWSHYTDLLNVMGYENLPLELHQSVLRQCTPPSAELRVSAARRLLAGNNPSNPHVHEGRFQTVIRNIRAIDKKPELDDYHFILEQFAAVGHHVGAMHVYKELTRLGITPRTKTFGLCLQAIAHRLTLPVPEDLESQRTMQTRRMMADLVADMQKLHIPFTSANLDLTIRILKETADMETFENLMKWGYGIDLSNPDRPPLEYAGAPTIKAALGMEESTVPGLSAPQPFSTAALNTTIDVLGRFGNVSKLVQAFEVLTQPLPRANEHLFSSFDDDDDFGVADAPKAQVFVSPHVSPNTTTYNMLLRHLCKAGHATLARHYLLEAMRLDRSTDSILRYNVYNYPLRRVFAPHFAINRGTLLPVFGESNRDKNIGLMRWLSTKIPSILKRKKGSLHFFSQFKENVEKKRERQAAHLAKHPRATANSAFLPSSLRPDKQFPSLLQRSRLPRPHSSSVFDVDIENPSLPSPPPVKLFNLDLHLRVLERDIQEIEIFYERLQAVLGRNTQRLKERLGRRVWAGKDVYMSIEGRRRKVTKEEWQRVVGFKPRKPVDAHNRAPVMRADAAFSPDRPFSTFFDSNQLSMREQVKEAVQSDSSPQNVPKHFTSTLQRR